MTGGCLLVAFAPDGATGNDDDDVKKKFAQPPAGSELRMPFHLARARVMKCIACDKERQN